MGVLKTNLNLGRRSKINAEYRFWSLHTHVFFVEGMLHLVMKGGYGFANDGKRERMEINS